MIRHRHRCAPGCQHTPVTGREALAIVTFIVLGACVLIAALVLSGGCAREMPAPTTFPAPIHDNAFGSRACAEMLTPRVWGCTMTDDRGRISHEVCVRADDVENNNGWWCSGTMAGHEGKPL